MTMTTATERVHAGEGAVRDEYERLTDSGERDFAAV